MHEIMALFPVLKANAIIFDEVAWVCRPMKQLA
jgi:hypothetical protein